MKKTVIATAVAASIAFGLVGCDDQPSDEEIQTQIEAQAKEDTMKQVAAEDVELQDKLKELKAADPSVEDAYYSYGDNGEKQLHVIRQDKDGSSMSDSVWPLVAGMAGGMLIANMINSGGASNYANRYPPQQYQSGFSREDERKRRNTYTSVYTSSIMSANRTAIRNTPARMSAVRSTVISTRTAAPFTSAGSARAASHSSFGG